MSWVVHPNTSIPLQNSQPIPELPLASSDVHFNILLQHGAEGQEAVVGKEPENNPFFCITNALFTSQVLSEGTCNKQY